MIDHFHHRRFRNACPRPASDKSDARAVEAVGAKQTQVVEKAPPIYPGEDAFLCWERPEDIVPRVHELLDHIADGGVNLYRERPFATTFRPVDHDFLSLPIDSAPFNSGIGESESGVQTDVETPVHPNRFGRGVDSGDLRIIQLRLQSRFLSRYAEFARRIVCSESATTGLIHNQPEQFKLAQGRIKRGVTPRFLFGLAGAPIDVGKDPCPIELTRTGNLGVDHVGAQPVPMNSVDVRRALLSRVALPQIIGNPIPRCVALLWLACQQFGLYPIQCLRDFQGFIRIIFSDRRFPVTLDPARVSELNPNVRTVGALISGEDHLGTVAKRSRRERLLWWCSLDWPGLGTTLSRLPSSLGCWFDSNAVQYILGVFKDLHAQLRATVAKERSKTSKKEGKWAL